MHMCIDNVYIYIYIYIYTYVYIYIYNTYSVHLYGFSACGPGHARKAPARLPEDAGGAREADTYMYIYIYIYIYIYMYI